MKYLLWIVQALLAVQNALLGGLGLIRPAATRVMPGLTPRGQTMSARAAAA